MDLNKHHLFFILALCFSLIFLGLFLAGITTSDTTSPQKKHNTDGKITISVTDIPEVENYSGNGYSSNVTARIHEENNDAIQPEELNDTVKDIEANYVTLEDATNNAFVALTEILYSDTFGTGVIRQDGIRFYPEPTVIFDANGKKLFYEFYAGTMDQKTLAIDVAASKVLGHPIIRAGESPGSSADLESITKKTQDIIDSKYSGYSIDKARFVCYAYPLTGIEVFLTRNAKDNKRILVTAWGEENDRIVQSYYDRIPPEKYAEKISEWETGNNHTLAIMSGLQAAGVNQTSPFRAVLS